MKKTFKTCLFFVLVLVGLCIAGVVVMFATDLCPPQGPWPTPPWCSDQDSISFSSPSLSGQEQVSPSQVNQMPTLNPYPVENTWGYVTPKPTLPFGTFVNITFEVSLPYSEQPVTLFVGEQTYPMSSENSYYFFSGPLQTTAGKTLEYYFANDEKRTEKRTITVHSDFVVRDGLNWLGDDAIQKPGFVKGYGTMDFGGFNVSELRGGRLPSTLTSMQNNGGEYFMFDHYWSYTDYTIPEIVDESEFPDMQYPTHDDISNMAALVHQQGMKFILLTSLEWSAIPGNPCYQYHGDANKLAECSGNYWLEGKSYEKTMLERLINNSNDEEALAYRDKWFAQYENFLLDAAQVAEENNIEMIIIGKNTIFADSPIHETQWRSMIQNIREVYHGQIGLIYECYNDDCLSHQPWVDDVDAAVLFYWFRLSEAESPSTEALRAEMTRINRTVINQFYQQHNVPVIIMTPFMSRDHPARQDWVEPASSAPEVRQDMTGQAELYELLFETSIDQPWFYGVIPYGYWFFDGFHPDFAFDRSYNVRNKPASLVLKSWFTRIDNKQ